ncbi:MAG TPA: ABC transporter permease [Bryobacteraceae bacterium]|nr:ABC transporter permease [Bryobacteraceae bacterium]
MSVRQHLEILAQDVCYALRGFFRAPMFTLAAVFAVAVGVGAGTAVFSVVDRVLFRSLPYPAAERLVSFGMVAPIVPQEFMLAYDYLDWRTSQTPFESLGAWSGVSDCDLNDTNPVRLRCAYVDASLLPALGVEPIRGRNFTAAEDRPNAPRAAIISHRLWQSRFAGDPGAIGRPVPLDGQPTAVVGVLPPGFELPSLATADLLVPLALNEVEQRTRRTATLLFTVGRLRPGVTVPQAIAALQPLLEKSLESVSPGFRKEVKLRLRPLRDRQIQDSRRASWILLASVLAVLLIACSNVANLLLARAAARRRELAVRAALGAGRGRLVRQALTESVLLGVAGGAAGCVLASLLLQLFVAVAPDGIPRLNQADVDGRVLLFTLAVSLLSGALFGLAPALQNPSVEFLTGWRTLGPSHRLLRQGLVGMQICVSMVLLTGAGLLLRSLWNLQNQPLGMRTDSVLTAEVTLGRKSYAEPARRLAFFEELEERLRRIPGVAEVALSDSLPPEGNGMGTMLYAAIDVYGRPRIAEGTGGSVASRTVSPRYFAALGIPILRGRGFQDEDRDPNRNVVILSDTLARRMFPGEDPLLKQIQPGRRGPWLSVIGLAGNVKNAGLIERDDPEFYMVRKRSPINVRPGAVAIIRGALDPETFAESVRAKIASIDPTLPVNIRTMEQRVGKLAERPRFNALLLGIFAAMGLLLAAVGLYGVVSFLVAQRTREIGVRMALGAAPAAITRDVLKRTVRWAAAGAVAGVIGSIFATRLLQGMLYRVSAADPWTFTGALAVLMGVTLLAAWIPSRRAARVDPMEALRQE